MARILVGTCNWSDHKDFYPPGIKATERLGYYGRHFPIVEVDATFYRLMPPRNFELWAQRTPDDFVFNVKAYRTLTRHGERFEPGARHQTDDPRLDPADEDFRLFDESIQPLRDAGKLRSILFQFPPWFKASDRNREYLSTCREYFPNDLVAIEFRHRSWLEPETADDTLRRLRDSGYVFTVVDQPQIGSGSIPRVLEVTNPALSIVRFHGRNYQTWYIKSARKSDERFDYLYPREELAKWVPRVEKLAGEAAEVHVLMNNNRGNYAVINAADMMELLGQPAPELDLTPTPLDRQARLPLEEPAARA